MPLYLHLSETPDIKTLAVQLKWQPADRWNGYVLLSASPSDEWGWSHSEPAGGSIPNDSTFDWVISLPADSARRSCVQFLFERSLAAYNKPADFYLVSVITTDSDDSVDSLETLGGATILGGSGRAEPGFLLPTSGVSLKVFATHSMAGATIVLSRDINQILAVATHYDGDSTAIAMFNLTPSQVGPYDVLVQRSAGASDTLFNSVRVVATTILGVDSLFERGGGLMPHQARFARSVGRAAGVVDSIGDMTPFFSDLVESSGCPFREGWVDPPTHGAIHQTLCPDDATPLECTLTAYPSRPGYPNTRTFLFTFQDCNDASIPNVPAALELIPQSFSGGHCHQSGPPPPAGVATGLGSTSCTIQSDGTIVCSGNTGSDGRQFSLTLTWSENAGYDHIVFYSTVPGFPFYNSHDALFKICSSASTSLRQVPEVPLALQWWGSNSTHPRNHFARASTAKAIRLAAQAFQQAFPNGPITQVNDMSLSWGGLFDIQAEPEVRNPPIYWTTPHREHRLGNNIDLRTHSLGVPRYSHAQLTALGLILRNYFTILKHPTSASDNAPPHWHLRVRETAVPLPWP
ncbi:MAG TPA: hypothetical protein VJY35_02540 [Candidatus Eisenbacteria bacterium]|nr:hypothetical protein [Candidatus Eisenbacteria bacterium]